MRKVWQHQRERWQYRNTKLHKDGKQQAIREKLLARIKVIYTKLNDLMIQDQRPFNMLLEQWEDKSVVQMKNWSKRNVSYINTA